jgi:hypothetical protein
LCHALPFKDALSSGLTGCEECLLIILRRGGGGGNYGPTYELPACSDTALQSINQSYSKNRYKEVKLVKIPTCS